MKKTGIILLIYSLMVLAGGILGHIQKGSQASLISGIVFGSLLLGNSLWMLKTKSVRSLYLALFLSFMIDGFFTFRFLKTQLFYPAGLMCMVTLGVIFVLVIQVRQLLKKAQEEPGSGSGPK